MPGASDSEAFWRLLDQGVDAIGEIPADRFNVDDDYDPDPEIYLAEVIRRLSPTSTPEQIAELTPTKRSVSLATDRAEAAA